MPLIMAAQRLALRLAYLGTSFAGWQCQRNARTVQGELETALRRIFRQEVRVVGAGRTDAGVHATGQIGHLDAPFLIPPAGLTQALNGILPADVRVLSCRRVPPTFHACLACVAKRYRYRLAWGQALDPWEGLRRWKLPIEPDLEVMRSCLRTLAGTHDFVAFALSGHSGHGARGTRRTIFTVDLRVAPRRADLVVEGDGFLRGMVRRIAGALVEVGRGARPVSWFADLVDARAAKPPAPTAPAHGLTLERVSYGARAGTGDAAGRHAD
jgi:tRNA pseudouridine38-40 synthase